MNIPTLRFQILWGDGRNVSGYVNDNGGNRMQILIPLNWHLQ